MMAIKIATMDLMKRTVYRRARHARVAVTSSRVTFRVAVFLCHTCVTVRTTAALAMPPMNIHARVVRFLLALLNSSGRWFT